MEQGNIPHCMALVRVPLSKSQIHAIYPRISENELSELSAEDMLLANEGA